MEFFILEDLKKEVQIDTNQLGGVGGSGTNHYLAKIWTDILQDLEQDNSACGLVSIDFAKAFNTMDHAVCIRALKRKGASQQSIQMVTAFLMDRQMIFKAGAAAYQLRNTSSRTITEVKQC